MFFVMSGVDTYGFRSIGAMVAQVPDQAPASSSVAYLADASMTAAAEGSVALASSGSIDPIMAATAAA